MAQWFDSNQQQAYAKQRWQQDYDDYMARIEQYKDSNFYQELLNNPYYQYQEYSPTWFQGVWAELSHSTSAFDRFYNERKTSGDEYLSQVLSAKRQQDYNDPAAQLARRTAAGLNDQLNGGSQIGSGESPATVPDETPPNQPEPGQDAQQALDVAGIGFQLFTGMMNFGSFVQEFSGKSIANAMADVQLTDQGFDSMVKLLAGSSEMPDSADDYKELSEEERNALDLSMIQQLDKAVKEGQLGDMYSTKRAKRLMKMMKGVVSYDKNGKPTLAYQNYRSKLLAERYGAHEQAAKSIGNVAFDENLMTFAGKIADTFGQMELKIRQYQEKVAEFEAKYSEEYYGTSVNGETVGTADAKAAIAGDAASSAEAQLTRNKAQLDNELESIFNSLLQECKSGSEWYHVAGRFLIPVARAAVYRLLNGSISASAVKGKSGFGLKSISGSM